MRYLSITSALMLVLSVTGCTDEAVTTSAVGDSALENVSGALGKKGVTHHVTVGGNDVCEDIDLAPGCDKNFSLVANMKADGSVSGQWQDGYGGGTEGVHVDVDCLNVDGNSAVIGGIVIRGSLSGEDLAGDRVVTAVVDNGTSSNDPPDQISFSFSEGFFDLFDFPADGNCAAMDVDDFINTPFGNQLANLTKGQVKVK